MSVRFIGGISSMITDHFLFWNLRIGKCQGIEKSAGSAEGCRG